MATIYAKKYKKLIDDGAKTLYETIDLMNKEVPEKWREDAIEKLKTLVEEE